MNPISLTNRVKQLYHDGKSAFGAHVKFPSPSNVDIAGVTGLDTVAIDPYHWHTKRETLENMIRCAYSYGMTPWVRCRNDPWEIMTVLDMGAQALAIPKCSSAAEAAAAVAGMYYPPKGRRESNRPLRFQGMTSADYHDWTQTQLLLCICIENREGIENLGEIVKVDGVDVIATERGPLSVALGVSGNRQHLLVLETEKRILGTALEAGKQVAFTCPTTKDGLEEGSLWTERGARILLFEAEQRVLMRNYREALADLRCAKFD